MNLISRYIQDKGRQCRPIKRKKIGGGFIPDLEEYEREIKDE